MKKSKLYLFVLALIFGQMSAGTQTAAAGENVNLLKNPSFEESTADGKPVGWSMNERTFSLVTESPRTGEKCLKFVNTDPSHYDFTSQRVDFETGDVFEFSCWVKTENIEGIDSGATICMQWSDREGKYMGGTFPAGLVGTHGDWTLIQGRTSAMNERVGSLSISLYVRREMTGMAWFDDITVKKYIAPYLSVMTTDRYRNMTDGGTVGVSVGLNPNAAESEPLTLTVSGESLAEPITLSATETLADEARFSFDSTPLAVGDYTLAVTAVHPKTDEPQTLRISMARVEKLPQFKAYIDSHRRFIVDGKPFFPLGMYCGGMPDSELEIYKNSTFNCLMPYSRIKQETLDKIDAAGVKVVYNLKDLYNGAAGLKSTDEADRLVTETIESLKDHPAIVAWYTNDEYPPSRISELAERRELIEQLDPSRPTWAVLYQIDEIREYLPTCDIIGTDPYPIATRPVSMAYDWSVKTNRGMFGYHAVWQVPQIFDWSLHKKSMAERQAQRAPTGQEMRAMYWMGIAGGANGLIAYCWHDLWNMDREPSDEPRTPLVRKPFEQSWSELTAIAQEISDCFDILLSVDAPMNITLDNPPKEPAVGMRLYGVGETTWTLLVNLTDEPQTVSLSAEAPVAVSETRLVDSSAVNVDGKKITVRLAALEPIFLGIKKAAP